MATSTTQQEANKMRDTPLTRMKKTVSNRIRHLSAVECRAYLEKMNSGIGADWIRGLTGGYSSQSIDEFVRLKLVHKIQVSNK